MITIISFPDDWKAHRVGSPNSITIFNFLQCKRYISASEHPFELIFWLRNRPDISLSIHMILIKKRQDLTEQQPLQRDLLQNFLRSALFLIPSHQLFSFPNYIISSKKQEFMEENIFFDRKIVMFFVETYIIWFVLSSSIDRCGSRFDQTPSS